MNDDNNLQELASSDARDVYDTDYNIYYDSDD